MTRPAHFFDLGGTLLALDGHDEIAYDGDGRVTILPGVRERLAALAGTPVFVVTNQAGVADGTLTPQRFHDFCTQLSAATAQAVTAYAACTHRRDAGCGCRKPQPGLVLGLATAHDIDLAASTMVGDTDTDRRLSEAAGMGRFVWAADYFGAAHPMSDPFKTGPATPR
jgi:D-glycero-D-manno-heptose 1,7-bisphosphate phosphatase